MKKWTVWSILIVVSAFVLGSRLVGAMVQPERLREIRKVISKIKPIHSKQEKPQPGQWLDQHKEPGQSFLQYSRSRPIVLTRSRNKIYVQPIGGFTLKQKELVKTNAEFLSIYFNCETRILSALAVEEIPQEAKRIHPRWGDKQILTTYVLDEVLSPALPRDAAALIAFTASDLWPGENWNFVFGQASLRNRVGIWSFYRHGKIDGTPEESKLCLKRTLKVATHETGHMFSINHCIHYRCNMQGSNSLSESDQQPISLCPECHAKVMWATGFDPKERYARLVEFCIKHDLQAALAFYRKSLKRFN
ncbi:MAG: archaemetzincin [Planctomycetota bacterium]|jgi:archaemetzincin|nr:archaemetzincin [Planctomycetota bacterium]